MFREESSSVWARYAPTGVWSELSSFFASLFLQPSDFVVLIASPYDLRAYCDASHDPKWSGSFVVGGWIATVEHWLYFDQEWDTVLNRPPFYLKYFRHSEFMACRKQFDGWRAREQDRRDLVGQLMAVMKARLSYGCAAISDEVVAKPYADKHTVIAHGYRPYVLSGLAVAKQMLKWRDLNHPDRRIHVVFESGTVDQKELRRLCDEFLGFEPTFTPKVQKTPGLSDRYIRPFEAADLLAGEWRKSKKNQAEGRPVRWIARTLESELRVETATLSPDTELLDEIVTEWEQGRSTGDT